MQHSRTPYTSRNLVGLGISVNQLRHPLKSVPEFFVSANLLTLLEKVCGERYWPVLLVTKSLAGVVMGGESEEFIEYRWHNHYGSESKSP